MQKRVVLWGTGEIAEVVYFYLEHDSEYDVAAFCVDASFLRRDEFHGVPVIAFEDIEKFYPPNQFSMCIPIGYVSMNKIRAEKYYLAKKKGYSFINYISSKATYYGTPVGENTIILENNVIQPFTQIGNNTIVWSGNHVGHHAKIGDHCFISSHVVISGSAEIRDYSFLGVNSTIRDSIIIEEENLIGAGSVVLKNTEKQEIYTWKGRWDQKKSDEVRRI